MVAQVSLHGLGLIPIARGVKRAEIGTILDRPGRGVKRAGQVLDRPEQNSTEVHGSRPAWGTAQRILSC